MDKGELCGLVPIAVCLTDAVTGALPDQSTLQGYYNVERKLKAVVAIGGRVKLCGTCAARPACGS